jgi:hypothetical protein
VEYNILLPQFIIFNLLEIKPARFEVIGLLRGLIWEVDFGEYLFRFVNDCREMVVEDLRLDFDILGSFVTYELFRDMRDNANVGTI